MKETLKAFVILERAGLLLHVEKAARALGIHHMTTTNTTDRLWEIAHEPEPVDETATSMVGSSALTEILTEKNPDFDPAAPPPSPVRRKQGPRK